jgi:hypothetical protein
LLVEFVPKKGEDPADDIANNAGYNNKGCHSLEAERRDLIGIIQKMYEVYKIKNRLRQPKSY